MEPLVGFEPTTIRLQGERSTSWAKVAYALKKAREILWKKDTKSNFFLFFEWKFFLNLLRLRVLYIQNEFSSIFTLFNFRYFYIAFNNIIMDNPAIFSQIFWPLFVILWISMISNKAWYQKLFKKIQKAHVSVFVMSLFSFIFWMYIISLYAWFWNIHEGFATVIGFIIVLKSAFYLLQPNLIQQLTKKFEPLLVHTHYIWSFYLLIWIFITIIAYI